MGKPDLVAAGRANLSYPEIPDNCPRRKTLRWKTRSYAPRGSVGRDAPRRVFFYRPSDQAWEDGKLAPTLRVGVSAATLRVVFSSTGQAIRHGTKSLQVW
jgi:hypothetical protein